MKILIYYFSIILEGNYACVFVYKEQPDNFQEQFRDVKNSMASLGTESSLEPSETAFQWQRVNLRTCLASFCQVLFILSKFTPQMAALLLKTYFDKEGNTSKILLFLLQGKCLSFRKINRGLKQPM